MMKKIKLRGIYSPTIVEPAERKLDISTEYAVAYDTDPYWDLTQMRADKKKYREVFSVINRGMAWVSPSGIIYPTNNELISACHIAMDLAEEKGTPIQFDEMGFCDHVGGFDILIESGWAMVDLTEGSIYQRTDLQSGEEYRMSHLQAVGVKVFERLWYKRKRATLLQYHISQWIFDELDSKFRYSMGKRYTDSQTIVERLNHHIFKPALLRSQKDLNDIRAVLSSEGQHNILYGGGSFYVEKRK
jgi:hypothetical protein